jgi:hypothetical protein
MGMDAQRPPLPSSRTVLPHPFDDRRYFMGQGPAVGVAENNVSAPPAMARFNVSNAYSRILFEPVEEMLGIIVEVLHHGRRNARESSMICKVILQVRS